MHELAVMQAVVDQVSERLGDQRVATIRLSVGRLSGVVPDALRFCFELSTSGTCLDGAELTIEEPPGQAHCRTCGRDFELDQLIVLCPCGSADVGIVGGDQLLIHSVVLAA